MLTKRSTYKIFYIPLIFAVLNLACKDKTTKGNLNSTEKQLLDSINSWIQKSRNSNLTINDKKLFLKKAENSYEKFASDSIKIRLISRISYSYLNSSDSQNFRRTNGIVLNRANEVKDSLRLAEAHWDLAMFFNSNSVPDSSYFHYAKAQKLYENLNKDFENARMLYNMARTQALVRDYTGSEINTIRAIEILKPLNEYKQLYYCYSNLGSVTKELKEFDRAIEYYQEAGEYLVKLNSTNDFEVSLQNNMGVVYQEQGKYQESIPYFQRVLRTPNLQEENPKVYGLALNHLAYSRLKAKQKKNVESDLRKSIQVLDSVKNLPGLARAYYNLSEFYLAQQDTTQAITEAQKALAYSRESNNNDRTLSTLQLLTKLEPEKSAYHNRNYISLNDSLQQEERQVRNKFARIRFETDEFIAENLLLARQKQLWSGIAIAVLLLGVMSYFILDQRVKNQKLRFQQQQQAANQEIFNLMLAQNQKKEEGKKIEQKRISEELHDGVLGKMLGARMVLTGLNKKHDETAEIERKKAIDALQNVEKEIRAISHELSHAAYQKINNFIHSVEDLLETVQATAGFNYAFDYDRSFNWDGIQGNTKINLYRLLQESLQNSVKHANCKNVSLNLQIKKNAVVAEVKDDGKGFKSKKGKKGIGMRNMASRIEKLNGNWNIKSEIGKGTTVTFTVPLKKITTNGSKEPIQV